MKSNVNYAEIRGTEDRAIGNMSRREPCNLRLSADVVAILNNYAETLHMTRTDVIEVFLMFAIKYLNQKKLERRCK